MSLVNRSEYELLPRFEHTWSNARADGDPRQVFESLMLRYREPHRGHHDARHILECLKIIDSLEIQFSDSTAVELAFFWHDAVYEIGNPYNEIDSMVLCIGQLSTANVSASRLGLVSRLILSYANGLPINDDDAKFFRDVDYAILGSAPDRYDEYAEGIRKEYLGPKCSPEEYQKGRSHFLLSQLEEKRLFLTDFFESRFAAQARKNIERELQKLQC